MAQICVLYAHPNKRIARRLVELLANRFTVWWDDQIHSGDYRAEIESQLSNAQCVVPVWCRVSRSDPDVVDEARFAERRRIPVLPVRIEEVDPPLGFGGLHTVDLTGWKGDEAHPAVAELIRNIAARLKAPPRLLPRPGEINTPRTLQLPLFFRSVSSYETPVEPTAALSALALMRTEAVLVSAYDLARHDSREAMIKTLTDIQSTGGVVLLDSGNYEAGRKKDKGWTPEQLHAVLTGVPHDLAFCFDDLYPASNVDGAVRGVLEAVQRESSVASTPILPIVHAPRDDTDTPRFELLPDIIARVARELRPTLVAVPERELGEGLLRRARTVFEIRSALDELGFYVPLHLLGTGNPLSIAVLAATGADCFDGLEWCRTVVDQASARLYHFHQYEFFSWQSEMAASPIVAEAVRNDGVAFSGKVLFHNLEFMNSWMANIQEMVRGKKIDRLLSDKLPGGVNGLTMLGRVIPEVFG